MTDSQVWTLSCQDSGTSTSDIAKAAALAGAPSGSAFLLHEQTAGRGRQGRQWASIRGGMYVSVLLYPAAAIKHWYALSFAAALAIRDIVETHLTAQIASSDTQINPPEIGLKWPNDVLVNNRKIAGILLETNGDSLIIGSGVNIAKQAPLDSNRHPPIAFADFAGPLPLPQQLAESYLQRLQIYYELWEENGFAPLRQRWLLHALHRHKLITVTLPNKTLTGVFDDLRHDGALVLLDESGCSHHITTGDVELVGKN